MSLSKTCLLYCTTGPECWTGLSRRCCDLDILSTTGRLISRRLGCHSVGAVTYSRGRQPREIVAGPGELDPRHVAVLYFDDRTDGRLAYLADGLTEALIDTGFADDQIAKVMGGNARRLFFDGLP